MCVGVLVLRRCRANYNRDCNFADCRGELEREREDVSCNSDLVRGCVSIREIAGENGRRDELRGAASYKFNGVDWKIVSGCYRAYVMI